MQGTAGGGISKTKQFSAQFAREWEECVFNDHTSHSSRQAQSQQGGETLINSFLKRQWSPLCGSELIGADTDTKSGRTSEERGKGKGEKELFQGRVGPQSAGRARRLLDRSS